MPNPPVSHLTGGCVCDKVRYKVDLKAGDSWPPDPHTCSCTQCRKWSGSILLHLVTFKPSQITWEGLQRSEFESSPGCFRDFCPTCGTNLIWRGGQEILDEVELCVGTLDKEFLKNNELAKDLCDPVGGRFWAQNEIPSVGYGQTGGKRHLEGSKSVVLE